MTIEFAASSFTDFEQSGVRMLVRSAYAAHAPALARHLRTAGDDVSEDGDERASVAGGRQPHPVMHLPDGPSVVVRTYRRGGMMRHLNRGRYFIGHRAFHELRVTERARAAGVRVPEVIGAMEKRAMIGYTAALATVLVPRAVELAGWLLGRPTHGEVTAAMREAGRQMGLMHAARIAHPDLNLRNILVVGPEPRVIPRSPATPEADVIPRSPATRDLQFSGDAPDIYIIDFDRARAYDGPVPPARRRRDLARLVRSIRKIGPPLPPDAMPALRAGYGEAWPPGVPSR